MEHLEGTYDDTCTCVNRKFKPLPGKVPYGVPRLKKITVNIPFKCQNKWKEA